MYHILKHEVGHFLGLRHSNDTLSLMYPIFSGENLQLSRNDSLTLIDIYDDQNTKGGNCGCKPKPKQKYQ